MRCDSRAARGDAGKELELNPSQAAAGLRVGPTGGSRAATAKPGVCRGFAPRGVRVTSRRRVQSLGESSWSAPKRKQVKSEEEEESAVSTVNKSDSRRSAVRVALGRLRRGLLVGRKRRCHGRGTPGLALPHQQHPAAEPWELGSAV